MVYRKYRLLAWLLALIMCASFCVAAFLPEGKLTGALGSEQSARPALTEESSLRLADTSSAFGDAVRIAPEVKGKQWLIVSLEDESLASRSEGQNVNAYAQTAKGRRAEKSLRSGQQEFLAGLQRAGIPYEYRYGYTLLLNAVAVRVDVRYAEQIARMDGVKSVDPQFFIKDLPREN